MIRYVKVGFVRYCFFCFWCLALVALPFRGVAHAHPHVFVDAALGLNFDAKGLASLDVTWVFDEMASQLFLEDLDTDADGVLEQSEWDSKKDAIADVLREQSFFVHVVANSERLHLTQIRNFQAKFDSGVLTYTMRLPLSIPDTPAQDAVQISVFDPSYYTDFYTPVESVSVAGKKGLSVSSQDAPDLAFYMGQVIPVAITFAF